MSTSVAIAAACGKDGATSPAAAPSASASDSRAPEVAPAVRRPTRRYFMTRLGDRCEVYFTDLDR
ncbi:MAG: hypothetical protein WCJ30_27505, partial [Deltaproteobacteria bacterium]